MPRPLFRLIAPTAAIAVAAVSLPALATPAAGARTHASTETPSTVHATEITPTPDTPKVGSPVTQHELQGETREFLGSSFGVALEHSAQSQSMAVTHNGGETWKVASPALHVDAAQGPFVVVHSGAASQREFYAFGGGDVIDTTSDGGQVWHRAYMGGVVVGVEPEADGTLDAAVEFVGGKGSGGGPQVRVFSSSDDGSIWHQLHSFLAF